MIWFLSFSLALSLFSNLAGARVSPFENAQPLSTEARDARRAEPLPNFHQVAEGIFRGGRPRGDGLVKLQTEKSVRTIVNIENNAQAMEDERVQAEKLGLEFLPFTMGYFERPSDELVDGVLNVLKDSSRYPVYLHCHHGEDRTGLIIGLYRVEVEGWAPQDAYREMLDLGFHPFFHQLVDYFRDRTGWNGEI